MLETPVGQWFTALPTETDIPNLRRSMAGMFSYILLLLTDIETTISLTAPFLDLLGVGPEDRRVALHCTYCQSLSLLLLYLNAAFKKCMAPGNFSFLYTCPPWTP